MSMSSTKLIELLKLQTILRYTNTDLKISLLVCVHIKTTP